MLRLTHTAWERDQDRYMGLDQHNRKQGILVHFSVLDQCLHNILRPIAPGPCTCPGPAPMQCE